MDGVTDAACRFMAKRYGRSDVSYTEFVSAEGLWRIKKRGDLSHKIWNELKYDRSERPVVAQLFGSDPDSFYEAAKIIVELGFDGIDINMGCPSPGLEKRGGGAGLMKDQKRAAEVIEATRQGIKAAGSDIPVSVKTRTGSSKPDPDWWRFLASQNLPVVAMHGRTFTQLYSGEADWDILAKAAEVIRNSGTLFLGNGDVEGVSIAEGLVRLKNGKGADLRNFDGVLIGRAAMGNPWVLRKDIYTPSDQERLKVAFEHAGKHEELFPDNFLPVRKHLVSYVKGMDNASGLRKIMVSTESTKDLSDGLLGMEK